MRVEEWGFLRACVIHAGPVRSYVLAIAMADFEKNYEVDFQDGSGPFYVRVLAELVRPGIVGVGVYMEVDSTKFEPEQILMEVVDTLETMHALQEVVEAVNGG